FGGTTSTVYSAPYFNASRAEDGIGLLELDASVAPGMTVSARDLVARRSTHLAGLAWRPLESVHTALTAGTGAGAAYAAGSFSYESVPLSLRSAYVHAGDEYRRAVSPRPDGSEVDRDNLLVTVRPSRTITLVLGRNHYLQPAIASQPALRG